MAKIMSFSEAEKQTIRFIINQQLDFHHVTGFLRDVTLSRAVPCTLKDLINLAIDDSGSGIADEIVKNGTAVNLACLFKCEEFELKSYNFIEPLLKLTCPDAEAKRTVVSEYLCTCDEVKMDLLGRENNDVIDWVMSRVPQPEQLSGHSYKIVESSEALFTYEPSLALVQHTSTVVSSALRHIIQPTDDVSTESVITVVESVESAPSTKRNPIESLKSWLKGKSAQMSSTVVPTASDTELDENRNQPERPKKSVCFQSPVVQNRPLLIDEVSPSVDGNRKSLEILTNEKLELLQHYLSNGRMRFFIPNRDQPAKGEKYLEAIVFINFLLDTFELTRSG